MSATRLTGNNAGTRLGCVPVVHTFPVNYNDTGISSGVASGIIIKASADKPVIVEVQARVNTAFNATTTNVLTVGTSTSANEWLTAAAVNETLAGLYPSNSVTAISFTGASAAGACTATGTLVGDRVLSVTGLASGTVGDKSASFESVVSVADQIQQTSASDLHLNQYLALLQRTGSVNRFRLTSDTTVYAKYTQSGTAATAGAATIVITEFQENTKTIV